jgi:hypothetical protein
MDLYHTALAVRVPEGRFIVETMWPSPDGNTESRGVVVEAPVFARRLSFTRVLRYEVRCWRDGILPDSDHAIGGPQLLSDDLELGRRLLQTADIVPALIWGRDQSAVGDMWNELGDLLAPHPYRSADRDVPASGRRARSWMGGGHCRSPSANSVTRGNAVSPN